MLVKLKKPYVQDGRVADVGEIIDVNQVQLNLLLQNDAVQLLNQSMPQAQFDNYDDTEDENGDIPHIDDAVEDKNGEIPTVEDNTSVADNAADDKSDSENAEKAYVTLGSTKRGGRK